MNTKEHRLFGPPGTGKTTALQHNIQSLVEHHGSDSIVVCSFSKAAATELVSRDLPIEFEEIAETSAGKGSSFAPDAQR